MKIISVFNQKGGVGKTTTAINLCAALAKKKKILLIDLDPQGNATSGLGIQKKQLTKSIYHVICQECRLKDVICPTENDNLDVVPSTTDLAAIDVELATEKNREEHLKSELEQIEDYDFIFIDCSPSLGLLSINGLVASQSVLIPIQCEYYALEGVGLMLETIGRIRQSLNPNLEIEGVVLSMYDGRNNLSVEVVEEVKKFFKDAVFTSVIPRNIRLAEAPSFGVSILDYDEKSKGARAYLNLSKEFLRKNK